MLSNTCPHCGKDRGSEKVCPHCEHRRETAVAQPAKRSSGCLTLVIILLCLIIGAVMLLAPNFFRARTSGRFMRCEFNLKNIGTALDLYAFDHQGHYPQNLDELVAAGYMENIPLCAISNWNPIKQDTYSETYVSSTRVDAYTFYCKGDNHTDLTDSDYPQYNSYKGFINHP